MADQGGPLRGDEAELFRGFNDALMRAVSRAVGRSSPEVIEDAVAFAWAAFLEVQPDRDRNWRGWLFRTAQRQAWRLERELRRREPLDLCELDETELDAVVAPIDEFEVRDEVLDALSLLAKLPPRLQRVALLRAVGFSCKEIGALTGDSRSRVQVLVTRANQGIRERLMARSRSGEQWLPRAERVWQLEHAPPDWLVERLGRPVGVHLRIPGQSATRRAWRRAAIALDDYRHAAGPAGFDAMDRELPSDPVARGLHATAIRVVGELERVRRRERGLER